MLLAVLEDEYCHFENWDLLTRAWRLSTVWLYRKYARSLKTKMTCSLYRGAKDVGGMVIKTQKDSLPLSLTLFESVRVWDSGYEIRNRVCVLPCS